MIPQTKWTYDVFSNVQDLTTEKKEAERKRRAEVAHIARQHRKIGYVHSKYFTHIQQLLAGETLVVSIEKAHVIAKTVAKYSKRNELPANIVCKRWQADGRYYLVLNKTT